MSRQFQSGDVLRRDKLVRPTDPFRQAEKYPSDTECPECKLLFVDGVWRQSNSRKGRPLHSRLCPACLQVRDGRVGGVVLLTGNYASSRRQDLLNRIRNVEKQTLEERPLERVISIKENEGEITVSATTEHLIAKIGKAIHRDFGGTLELKYAPEEKFATAHWHRDE